MGFPRSFPALPLLVLALANCDKTERTEPTTQASASPPSKSAAPPASSAVSASHGAPVAAKRPVEDDYSGTKITDDYRWLEDATNPEVKAWSDAENKLARATLDAIPFRAALKARVTTLMSDRSPDWFSLEDKGGTLFALKDAPPKQQPFIVSMASPEDSAHERVILDPAVIDPSGKTAIDFYVPSRDKKLIAVSLSQGGSESGTVHVYEAATGKERTADVVPRVNGGTAGGGVAWNADGSGFFYTHYPREGEPHAADPEFYQHIYFHTLGEATKNDMYVLGEAFPRIAETHLATSPDGKYVLAHVRNGDGGEVGLYIAGPCEGARCSSVAWTKVADFKDKHTQATMGEDGMLYMLSLASAPKGKIVRVPLKAPQIEKEEVVVPEQDAVIQGFTVTASQVYVSELIGGPSKLVAFPSSPKKGAAPVALDISIPAISALGQLVRLQGDDLLFRRSSLTEPPAWYLYKAATKAVTKTPLAMSSAADFSDASTTLMTCTSKDGTKVPLTILAKRDVKKDGTNPTLLNGYGGYALAQTPGFRTITRLWLDQGGVWALAHVRGGNEFGEAWHLGGNLANKQNVFDDFAACAEQLIADRYTSKEHLAALGGSNGGLLMGAEVTQHPDLFHAVVSAVGIYDMLRVENDPNGAYNVTEFGSTKDPKTLPALLAYSPLHHVKDGTPYPAMLLTTGANDRRVLPYHSRKMVARLQAANSSKNPILLRTSGDTGHGIGTPLGTRIEELTDVYGFLFSELGVDYRWPR